MAFGNTPARALLIGAALTGAAVLFIVNRGDAHPEQCCCAFDDGSHEVMDHEECENAGGECHDMDHCDAGGRAPCSSRSPS